MRIVDRKAFLALPTGTIYCKGTRWAFDSMSIKGESLENDWFYQDPAWVEADDSGEAFDRLETMLANNVSFPCEKREGRDGCFDEKEIFMIFERDDLTYLMARIDHAIKLTAPTISYSSNVDLPGISWRDDPDDRWMTESNPLLDLPTKTVTEDEHFELKLINSPHLERAEISVVDTSSGIPIPFQWVDHDTLSVSKAFAEVAGIKYTPRPPSARSSE